MSYGESANEWNRIGEFGANGNYLTPVIQRTDSIRSKSNKMNRVITRSLFCMVLGLCSCDLMDPGGQRRMSELQSRVNANPNDKDALAEIVEATRSRDGVLRCNAIDALGQIAKKNSRLSQEILPILISVLKHNDDFDKRVAASELVEIAGPDTVAAIPALTESLKEGNTDVGWFSAEALGNYGPLASSSAEELQKALIGGYQENANLMSECAAHALGKIGNVSARETLLLALDSPNVNVQLAALEALLMLNQSDSKMSIKTTQLLADERKRVREETQRIMKRAGQE